MNSFKDMTIVALFGVPRTGTSWLGQILNSSPQVAFRFQPLFSYEFKDRLNEHSSRKEIERFYNDLMNASSDFVLQKTNTSGKKGIHFSKGSPTALVWKEVRYLNLIRNLAINSDTKFIFIIRHPAGAINSWLNAPKEFDKSWDPLEEWRYAEKKNKNKSEEFNGYEKWKEAAEIFLQTKKDFPQRTYIVKYEDLINEGMKEVKKIFGFINLPLEKQTQDFWEASTSLNDNDAYGVYRESPDPYRWKQELDDRIIKNILEDFDKSELKKELGY